MGQIISSVTSYDMTVERDAGNHTAKSAGSTYSSSIASNFWNSWWNPHLSCNWGDWEPVVKFNLTCYHRSIASPDIRDTASNSSRAIGFVMDNDFMEDGEPKPGDAELRGYKIHVHCSTGDPPNGPKWFTTTCTLLLLHCEH